MDSTQQEAHDNNMESMHFRITKFFPFALYGCQLTTKYHWQLVQPPMVIHVLETVISSSAFNIFVS